MDHSTTPTSRIGIYCRISLDWEGEGLGVERQRQDGLKLAASRRWVVADTYIDNNLSAYRREVHRPEFQRLLRDLEDGRIAGIVAYDLDRVFRQPKELERAIDLYESRPGLHFATVQADYDLSTSDGRTMARVMVAFANKSSADTSQRQIRKNIERALKGLPHGSRRPYGYQTDLVTIHEPEAEILREMARRLMAGNSYKEIAYWANEQGHRTTLGKLWYPLTVRNMLRKKRYGGIREYQGAEYPAVWEPVFDQESWERLQLTLKLKRESASRVQDGVQVPVARKYLLTGLAYCGSCGRPLNGSQKRDRPDAPMRRTYLCRVQGDAQRKGGCGKVRRGADPLEDLVVEAFLYRLDTPDLAKLLQTDRDINVPIKSMLEDRQAVRNRLDGLVDDYATGLLDRPQFARAKAAAELELQRLEEQIAVATRSDAATQLLPVGMTVRKAWEESESDEWRRQLLGLVIERIVVNPGITKPYYTARDGTRYRFDPTLIDIRWKY